MKLKAFYEFFPLLDFLKTSAKQVTFLRWKWKWVEKLKNISIAQTETWPTLRWYKDWYALGFIEVVTNHWSPVNRFFVISLVYRVHSTHSLGCSSQLVLYSVHLKHLPAFTRPTKVPSRTFLDFRIESKVISYFNVMN